MDMNDTIERIHEANAAKRRVESGEWKAESGKWRVGRWLAPAAVAAAAVVLLVVLPRGNATQAAPAVAGVYCNSQCNPDDVMVLIDNQINHIKTLQIS